MRRYIKANTAKINYSIAKLQDSSNELVDLILSFIDNLPDMEQHIAEYDAENDYAGTEDSLEEEFISDVKNVCDDINYACKGIINMLDYYKPRRR